MSQFQGMFFDEAAEHLTALETILLRIDPAHPAPADVAEVFRCAHSIKGGSATFGFADMAELTHVMETLLDAVRKGRLPLDRARVGGCLAAVDILRRQLLAHRDGVASDPLATADMCRRLAGLCHAAEADPAVPARSADGGGALLDLHFVVARMVAGSEVLIENMLDELAALGELVVTEHPPGGAAGGEWHVRLRTARSEPEVRAVMDLVTEPGQLRIAPVVPAPGADLPGLAGAALAEEAEDGSYGFFVPVPPLPDTPAPAPAVAGEGADPRPAMPARGAGADNSIRVNVDKVDHMINLVGELVITQSILQAVASEVDPLLFERLMSGIAQLERNTRELQESVMSIRMLPVSTVFSRFPRMVRDLAERLGKAVELQVAGEHTELDKALIERIADPLTHLVRNCLDHGIEPPPVRRAAGKAATGLVTLHAAQHGGHILIEVADDGAGLDRARILARARERGMTVSDAMADEAVWQLVFEPGFSTAETVTELSGRGVGMDVVKRSIGELGGQIEIHSVAGRGARFSVRLPLTLAIVDGMTVAVGEEIFVVPLDFVVESLQPARAMIRSVGGVERMIEVRGSYLPVLVLADLFAVPCAVTDWTAGIMVLVEVHGTALALFVDALVGQQQVVIKSLEANFRRVDGFAGATILGDGRVALILDMTALAARLRRGLAVAA